MVISQVLNTLLSFELRDGVGIYNTEGISNVIYGISTMSMGFRCATANCMRTKLH